MNDAAALGVAVNVGFWFNHGESREFGFTFVSGQTRVVEKIFTFSLTILSQTVVRVVLASNLVPKK